MWSRCLPNYIVTWQLHWDMTITMWYDNYIVTWLTTLWHDNYIVIQQLHCDTTSPQPINFFYCSAKTLLWTWEKKYFYVLILGVRTSTPTTAPPTTLPITREGPTTSPSNETGKGNNSDSTTPKGFYSGSRLMWSLWDQAKLITLTEW